MKSPKVNFERRKLFTRFGIGAISAAVHGSLPVKMISAAARSEKKSEQQKISISINPMAVKRTNKG